jgi:hypothetical protein
MTTRDLIHAITALIREQPEADAEATVADLMDERMVVAVFRLWRMQSEMAVVGRLVNLRDRGGTWN